MDFLKNNSPLSAKTMMLYCGVAVIAVTLTTIVLSRFATHIQPILRVHYGWELEFSMVLGQLVFQYLFVRNAPKETILVYCIGLLCISGLGSLLLVPLLIFTAYNPIPITGMILYFFAVVGIMFITHKVFVSKLMLPKYISYTWVLYRCLILLFIL
ncbi:MAG: hypothetical protein JNJ85_00920 [Candidatus Kapabacteria bacterium]|nr:hypothetical protein [Candidatus Kapabacteria bacterium]